MRKVNAMAKAKKLPSGNWRVLVYSHTDVVFDKNGNPKKVPRYVSFTDSDKNEAEFKAAEFKRSRTDKRHHGKITFHDAAEQYIAMKSNVLSPSTIRSYRVMLKNSFPLLVDKPLAALCSCDLIQRQMNENAKSYSAKSQHNQASFISAVMKANRLPVDPPTLKAKEDKTIPVPTKAEIERIMELLHTAPEIECQALLALTCSLRQSEIAALTPAHIEGNMLHVRGARVKNEKNELVYKQTNKTLKSARDILMPDFLAGRLAALCDGKAPSDFLFTLSSNALLKRFQKLLRDNGMYPYTIHALRHSFAALLHAQNVPDKYIMALGGWSSEHVMKKVYTYTFEEETKAAKDAVNRYFDEKLN
nr:MAG TPA: Integrase [Caudoviricetes sp.]